MGFDLYQPTRVTFAERLEKSLPYMPWNIDFRHETPAEESLIKILPRNRVSAFRTDRRRLARLLQQKQSGTSSQTQRMENQPKNQWLYSLLYILTMFGL